MKKHVIQTRLDQATTDKLKKMAAKEERTISALIRFILKNHLKRNNDA